MKTEPNEKPKQKTMTFKRGMCIFVAFILSFITFIFMLLCSINPIVIPTSFVLTAYFGLAFWPIFFVNVFLLIILVLLRAKKAVVLPILTLIISILGFLKSYSFPISNAGWSVLIKTKVPSL